MTSTSLVQYFYTKPKLLAILQMGGASSCLFNADEVVYYLGKYIEKKELYDPLNKRIIRCGQDLLGEVFRVEQFTVTDFKNLWKYLFPCLYPATKKEMSTSDIDKNNKQGESSTEVELPWWYFVKREHSETNQSQTTGRASYDGRETADVQDSEYEDSEYELIEYEPVDPCSDSDDTNDTEPITSDEENIPHYELESLQKFQTDSDEDTTTDFSMDSDIALEELWSCTECRTKNLPTVGYCQRCWKNRQGWVKEQQNGLHRTLTEPIPSCQSRVELPRGLSLDVPDGRGGKHKLNDPQSFSDSMPKKMHLDESSKLSSTGSAMSDSTMAASSSNESLTFPGLCSICRNNQNDATIVHGNSGHQFCCFRCAKRLKKRGKNCPVCRRPIMLVIRNYIVQL